MVALSTLCGLLVPSVLVRMSCTPAASSTGRTAPAGDDAGALGRPASRNTRAAPKCPVISQGIVVSLSGDEDQILLGVLDRLADRPPAPRGALPRPTPTWPRPSPTTTSAVKENRRPPLTTLATRLMETTRSFKSSALAIDPSLPPLSSLLRTRGPPARAASASAFTRPWYW